MTTDAEIKHLRELLAKAPQLPLVLTTSITYSERAGPVTVEMDSADCVRLAYAAVNALPSLLDYLEAARSEVERLKGWLCAADYGFSAVAEGCKCEHGKVRCMSCLRDPITSALRGETLGKPQGGRP